MEGSCARAVELGLPSIAFTEHVDLARWHIAPEGQRGDAARRPRPGRAADGRPSRRGRASTPPPLDVDGYLASIERCRRPSPSLRIVTGLELGEPHWFADRCTALLATGAFERVLGSLHSLEVEGKTRGVQRGVFASG